MSTVYAWCVSLLLKRQCVLLQCAIFQFPSLQPPLQKRPVIYQLSPCSTTNFPTLCGYMHLHLDRFTPDCANRKLCIPLGRFLEFLAGTPRYAHSCRCVCSLPASVLHVCTLRTGQLRHAAPNVHAGGWLDIKSRAF